MPFVWAHLIWFAGWTIINIAPGIRHFDPLPFNFLTLIVSLEAIFLSTFILRSLKGRKVSKKKQATLRVAGRDVSLSNLDKVMYPEGGFTKGRAKSSTTTRELPVTFCPT
jgi:hypothetical protein